jgi:hypothetical protein
LLAFSAVYEEAGQDATTYFDGAFSEAARAGRRCTLGGNSMTHLQNADATQEGGKSGQAQKNAEPVFWPRTVHLDWAVTPPLSSRSLPVL